MVNKSSGLAAQLAPINCPCCQQRVEAPTLEMISDRYKLTAMQHSILSAVWRGKGMPVSTSRIFDAMYADDPSGGPSNGKMYSAFKAALFALRVRLKGSGVSIECAGYCRGYRLILGVM